MGPTECVGFAVGGPRLNMLSSDIVQLEFTIYYS